MTFASTRITRRLFVLAAGLILIPWIAIFGAALSASSTYLEPELLRRTEAIAHSAAGQIERALSLGIPLREIRGMDTFLSQLLAENGEIASFSVLDAAGRRVFHAGVPPGGKADVRIPIQIDGKPAASLVAEQRGGGLERIYEAAQGDLIVALLVALFASYELIYFLVGRFFLAPLALADEIVERVGAGDFRHVALDAAGGEIGHLLAALNRVNRQITRRFAEIRGYAEDVAAAIFRPDATARIEGELAAARSGRLFATDTMIELEPRHQASLFRFLCFLAATAAVLHLVGLIAVSEDRGVPLNHVGFVLLLAGAAALSLFAGRLLDPVLRPLGTRGAGFLGGALVAAAGLLAGPGLTGWWLVGAELAAGLGVGVLLHGAADRYGLTGPFWGGRYDRRRIGAITGIACGAALAPLLADALGPDGLFHCAGLLGGLAALLALMVLPNAQGGEPPQPWLKGMEIATLMREPRVAVLAALVVAPPQALGAGWLLGTLPQLADGGNWTAARMAGILLSFGTAAMIGAALVRAFAATDRRRVPALAAGLALAALAALLGGLVGPGAHGAVAAAAGLGIGATLPVRYRLTDLACRRQGARLGERRIALFVRMASAFATVAGTLAGGLLSLAVGPEATLSILGAFAAGAAGLLAVAAFIAPSETLPSGQPS